MLTPWLTQVRCQELQKTPRCHQQLGGLNFVPVALACPSPDLADLDVTAPAIPTSLPPWMDFACGGHRALAGGSQSRWHHHGREEGWGCVWLTWGGGGSAS